MKKLLVVALLVVIGLFIFNGTDKKYQDVSVTISNGDTLWSIAEEHISRGEVMDEVVYRIRKKNPEINPGSLQLGQKVIVPVLVEK